MRQAGLAAALVSVRIRQTRHIQPELSHQAEVIARRPLLHDLAVA
jgi:hypothetical protein